MALTSSVAQTQSLNESGDSAALLRQISVLQGQRPWHGSMTLKLDTVT